MCDKQPRAVGEAYVDYSANAKQVKITVWVERDPVTNACEIASHDEVEIRTRKRTVTQMWDCWERCGDD